MYSAFKKAIILISVFLELLFSYTVAHADFNLSTEEADLNTNTIVWAKNDAPPFYLLHGPDKGQAIGDQIQAILERHLTQYQHKTVEMTLARLNHSWKNDSNLCFSTMIHEWHHDYSYILSIPNLYYSPHGIIAKKSSLKIKSNSLIPLSLDKLLENKDIEIGKISDRTFGLKIDNILKQHKIDRTKIGDGSSDQTVGVLNMLVNNRIDFIIDYPYVVEFYAKQFNNQLVYIPIEEVKNDFVPGAIGCTNNRWGKAVIKDINKAIRQLHQDEEYKAILKKWLVPKGYESNYWQAYKNIYRSL